VSICPAGLDLIKSFEGLRLKPYKCPAGVLTIGYGHTRTAAKLATKYPNGITPELADALLQDDLLDAERTVREQVKVPLNPNQYAALVSFVFNLGAGNFLKSSLLRFLNAEDYAKAASLFPIYCKAGGVVQPGLIRRRQTEKALFLEAPPCQPA